MTSSGALREAEQLARDILDEVRSTLMTTFRFLDIALWRMPSVSRMTRTSLASDGYRLYFNPLVVIEDYRMNPNELVRGYLHCILHCVFRHGFDEKHPDTRGWDLACDIAVEATALELAGMRFPCEFDKERTRALEKISALVDQVTAQKLYRIIVPRQENGAPGTCVDTLAGFEVKQLAKIFDRDDHAVWTRRQERPEKQMVFTEDGKLIDEDMGEKLRGGEDQEPPSEETKERAGINSPGVAAPSTGGPAASGEVENPDRFVSLENDEEAEPLFESMKDVEIGDFEGILWKDISKQIQMDMEAFSGKIGSTAGTFLVNLSVTNRKTYDYRDFLKRFSSQSEELKVSTDEFDYVYYTYGLKLYKNMPLVEPLEYQESNRVRDFVIAIDTSASCGGSLVKQFVEKTYDVLKSESGFGRKINVYIIQCDCDIRKVIKVTNIRDIDTDFMDFEVRGYGGTDFRPVFKYVDELVASRELLNLKGLIYLTDGLGKFPNHPPEYDTAFVFVDDSQRERKVPPWAMKVIMSEDEIVEL